MQKDIYIPSSNVHNRGEIELKVVHKAIKSISLDTTPGPDVVLIKTIKTLGISHIIETIIDIIIKFGYVPEILRRRRTVLIYNIKGRVPILCLSLNRISPADSIIDEINSIALGIHRRNNTKKY